jgi:nitrite reductase/ring-hydroxylating ferredoxin subunit
VCGLCCLGDDPEEGIEEALRSHYPDFKEVVAEEVEKQAGPQLLQIENLHKPVFVDAGAAASSTRRADGSGVRRIQFCLRTSSRRSTPCGRLPVDGNSLGGARLTDEGVIVCPWHNCAYDVRTVPGLTARPRRRVIPVAMRNGTVQVAVNVA